jgi:hypothetical protein
MATSWSCLARIWTSPDFALIENPHAKLTGAAVYGQWLYFFGGDAGGSVLQS